MYKSSTMGLLRTIARSSPRRLACSIGGRQTGRDLMLIQAPQSSSFSKSGVRLWFSSTPSPSQLFKVAIVGSGPSGCYTAKYLQSAYSKHYDQQQRIQIDVLDRLPTPYGLVRYGVAPDHPEVKNVQNDFDQLFATNINDSGAIHFWGNVHVGHDVQLDELRRRYHAVVLAYGCESDRKLGIPGEQELAGILSAREFVAWYNGHPDYDFIGDHVAAALKSNDISSHSSSSVVVIGQGNVALDCARILAKSGGPLSGGGGLADTDLSSRAMTVLDQVNIRDIIVCGRRGHVQGAFTIKELRELTKLKDDEGYNASLVVREDELNLGSSTEASVQELASSKPKQRIDKLLREAASVNPATSSSESGRVVQLRFLLNPVAFEGDESKLARVVCERTRLVGPAQEQRAVGTGELEVLDNVRLAITSIGYKAVALPGTSESDGETKNWFDDRRGVWIHDHGRIDAPSKRLGGLYTSGWVKRGPSGIIGTNIGDAKETVATIIKDLEACQAVHIQEDEEDLKSLLQSREVKVVDWQGYQRIDQIERTSNRRNDQQPREKITSYEQMLQIALGTQ